MKTILGFMHHTHDATAALLDGSGFLAAVEEERVNRKKHTDAFPEGAIREVLRTAHVNFKDVTHVAYPWKPSLRAYYGLWFTLRHFPGSLRVLARRGDGDVVMLAGMQKRLAKFAASEGWSNRIERFEFVEHHMAHAAYAWNTSDFDRGLIYTHDFCGEYHSILIALGEGNKITPLVRIPYPNSMGFVFNAITKYLGFRRNCDEGKLMGLAPYGDARYVKDLCAMVKLEGNGTFTLDTSWFDIFFYNLKEGGESELVSQKFIQHFGPPRKHGEELTDHHRAMSYALQEMLYKVHRHLIGYWMTQTNCRNLTMSGGIALNSCANGLILEEGLASRLHLPPAAGDAGAAPGAALYLRNQILGCKDRVAANPYQGPGFRDELIRQILLRDNIDYEEATDIVPPIVAALKAGKIIGWFQGRMEFGPRALGARSILVDPRRAEMRDHLNSEIKHRELFRPFAPSMTLEAFSDFFEGTPPSPYMLMVYKAKPGIQEKIPAVIHVDGTARVQTVTSTENPLYHRLIRTFGEETGVPVVLNTSFNDRGEPIVATPEDALGYFLRSGIDVLAMGNFLIHGKKP